jgi:hypothetical protein
MASLDVEQLFPRALWELIWSQCQLSKGTFSVEGNGTRDVWGSGDMGALIPQHLLPPGQQ